MSSKQTPIHRVAVGPVTVDIFRGAANDGHTFLYYEVSRAWSASGGKKTNFSPRFYDRNEKHLCAAVQKASTWIRKNPQAADEGWDAPAIAA